MKHNEFVNAQNVLNLFFRLSQGIRNLTAKTMPTDLTFQQLRLMFFIEKGMTITQISKKLEISRAAISKSVSQLVRKGYVTKEFIQDKRTVSLQLTINGKEMLDQVLLLFNKKITQGIDILLPEEREALTHAMIILKKLLDRLS